MLSFLNVLSFNNDKVLNRKFDDWRNEARLKQVSCVTTLTAFLYLLFAYLHYLVLPEEISFLLACVNVFVLAPYLFFLSYLAKDIKHIKLLNLLLVLAPIVAALWNVWMTNEFELSHAYMTELYLIIFWIFTVSGMRFYEAILSAFMVFIITVVSFLHLEYNELVMHIFWSSAAFSFGFLGAFLFERSEKNVFLHERELQKLAHTDTLTGLHNRARFDILVEKELSRMKRMKHQFACAFVDIDYFKSINDNFGHKVGDEVLIEVSKLILGSIRQSDSAIRWGGEEFIIMCIEVDKDGALAVCEHLRKSIEMHTFSHMKDVSVSIGLTLSHEDDDVNSIVQRADKALYMAKDKGRNCCVYLD